MFHSHRDCDFVHHINSSAAQCAFVQANPDCQADGGFIDYIDIYFCIFSSYKYLAILAFVTGLLILFISLATTADDFFCPNLAVIAKTLRLSQNVAGVTIMAFGNGAPDIFSSLAGISQSRPELVIGELFGAGIFVTTVVSGAICITKPFKLMERPFLRDIIFYLGAGFWAFWIFYRGHIDLYDSLGFLALYVFYILVVVIGRAIHQRQRRSAELLVQQSSEEEPSSELPSNDDGLNIFTPNAILADEAQPITESDEIDGEEVTDEEVLIRSTSSPTLNNINGSDPELNVRSPWKQLFQAIVPWDGSILASPTTSSLRKMWEVTKSPVVFLLNLTIPILNEDLHQMGWCQYLVVLQCLIAPQFAVFATSMAFFTVYESIVLWHLMIVLGQTLAIFILCTSVPFKPPIYHTFLSYVGFFTAVIWIYLIANEIVSLLKTFGVLFGLSDAILGLTVLAWGNSIGDLIADTSIARQGYPRMGYSACFGGPLFNHLLGIGIPFTKVILEGDGRPVLLNFTPMIFVLAGSLAVALLTSLIMMPLSRFRATRRHGFFLIFVYLVLLTVALTVEFTVIF